MTAKINENISSWIKLQRFPSGSYVMKAVSWSPLIYKVGRGGNSRKSD